MPWACDQAVALPVILPMIFLSCNAASVALPQPDDGIMRLKQSLDPNLTLDIYQGKVTRDLLKQSYQILVVNYDPLLPC
jgi:hypothetical protein